MIDTLNEISFCISITNRTLIDVAVGVIITTMSWNLERRELHKS